MSSLPEERLHLQVLASGPQRRISELHRFGILLVGSYGMVCASLGYAFNLIMPSMQERYNFSQREVASISVVGMVFGYFMLPFGTLYDYMGPVPVAIVTLFAYPLGALLTALCFEGVIEGSVVRLCVFNAIKALGPSNTDLVCCMTVLSHFPSNRGPVIALLKTFLGLGSAIVGSLFTGFFNGHISHFLYFLVVFSFVANAACLVVVRLPAYHLTQWQESHLPAEEKERRLATKAQYLKQKPPMWRFVYGFIILAVLIVYLPTTSALVTYRNLGRGFKLGFALVTVAIMVLYAALAVPLPASLTRRISWCKNENVSEEDDEVDAELGEVVSSPSVEHEPCHAQAEGKIEKGGIVLLNDSDISSEAHDGSRRPVETDVDYTAPQYQGSFLQNLKTLEMWALWWSMFAVDGTNFVLIYNATFILGAVQGSRPSLSQTTLLTVLNGVGSAVGRLLMSAFEVWSQKRRVEERVPITIALFFSTSTVIITVVLFLTLPAVALPLPFILTAMSNGFCGASQILVTRTIFAKDPAKHYHFCFSSAMVAGIVLNRFLYAEWYTVQAEKQNSKVCFGRHCVMMPLLVLLGLVVSAFATDVILHLRYRAYSLMVLAERALLRGEADSAQKAERYVDEAPVGDLDDGLSGAPAQRRPL